MTVTRRARQALSRLSSRVARVGWRRLVLAGLALAVVVVVVSEARRPSHPPGPGEPIEIAVVCPPDQDTPDFLFGIAIAIKQINAAGGMLGHPVVLRKFWEDRYTDKANLETVAAQSLRLATEIGRIPAVLAVIGHGSSATAVPASAVYERYDKLFLATHATATSLTNHHLDLTFGMQPSNADNAAILAEYARREGFKQMVVVSDSSNYGIETADQFRSRFARNGGTTLHRVRLGVAGTSINDDLLFLLDNKLFKSSDIQAFFIASSSEVDTGNFIARTRQLGLNVPILGPEYLVTQDVQDVAGKAAMRNVVSVSLYGENEITPERQKLSEPFQKLTGHAPGLLAAIGFDTVKVLAYAVQRTGNLEAGDIADTLRIIRYEAPFTGATGTVVFDANGLITDTTAYVVRHDGTGFKSVATFHKPLPESQDDP